MMGYFLGSSVNTIQSLLERLMEEVKLKLYYLKISGIEGTTSSCSLHLTNFVTKELHLRYGHCYTETA